MSHLFPLSFLLANYRYTRMRIDFLQENDSMYLRLVRGATSLYLGSLSSTLGGIDICEPTATIRFDLSLPLPLGCSKQAARFLCPAPLAQPSALRPSRPRTVPSITQPSRTHCTPSQNRAMLLYGVRTSTHEPRPTPGTSRKESQAVCESVLA